MSSSEFAPLVPEPVAARAFRALGAEPAAPAPEAAPPPLEESEAYRAGRAAGRAEAAAEQAALAQALAAAASELAAVRAALPARWEGVLLDVALGVARAIVREELATHPERWLAMLRDGIRRAVDREQVVLRVPPGLAAYLEGALPDLRATLAEVRELTVLTDATLAETACRVETRFGDVDLGVETQLARARATLHGEDA